MDDFIEDDDLTPLAMAYDLQIIGQSLLDGDLTEARFRTLHLAVSAEALGRAHVVSAAAHLSVALTPAQGQPVDGIGLAYAALAASVELAANLDPPS